jgi:hypothetical protein
MNGLDQRPLAVISNEERNLASPGKNVFAAARFLLAVGSFEMTRRGAEQAHLHSVG